MKLRRKGQMDVGGLQPFILAIVAASVVLAIGLIILTELSTTTKELDTTTQINESRADGSVLTSAALLIAVSECRNGSSVVLDAGLYCNVSSGGTVSVSPFNTSGNVFIDYSHYTPSAALNASNSTITKIATIPTWIGIIIIVALAFIVLSFFIGRRQ